MPVLVLRTVSPQAPPCRRSASTWPVTEFTWVSYTRSETPVFPFLYFFFFSSSLLSLFFNIADALAWQSGRQSPPPPYAQLRRDPQPSAVLLPGLGSMRTSIAPVWVGRLEDCHEWIGAVDWVEGLRAHGSRGWRRGPGGLARVRVRVRPKRMEACVCRVACIAGNGGLGLSLCPVLEVLLKHETFKQQRRKGSHKPPPPPLTV